MVQWPDRGDGWDAVTPQDAARKAYDGAYGESIQRQAHLIASYHSWAAAHAAARRLCNDLSAHHGVVFNGGGRGDANHVAQDYDLHGTDIGSDFMDGLRATQPNRHLPSDDDPHRPNYAPRYRPYNLSYQEAGPNGVPPEAPSQTPAAAGVPAPVLRG